MQFFLFSSSAFFKERFFLSHHVRMTTFSPSHEFSFLVPFFMVVFYQYSILTIFKKQNYVIWSLCQAAFDNVCWPYRTEIQNLNYKLKFKDLYIKLHHGIIRIKHLFTTFTFLSNLENETKKMLTWFPALRIPDWFIRFLLLCNKTILYQGGPRAFRVCQSISPEYLFYYQN